MNTQVAQTILEQLGGGRFVAMTGARRFAALRDGLMFDLPRMSGVKASKVKIVLDPSDTYTMTTYQIRQRGLSVVKLTEDEGLYDNNLAAMFTARTGLDTRIS